MTISYHTIRGKLTSPAGDALNHYPLIIEATSANGDLVDTVGNQVWTGRTQVNPGSDGSYEITLPDLPQADILPVGARWRLIRPGAGKIYRDPAITQSAPEPVEFALSADMTWDEVIETADEPVTGTLIAEMTDLRDETIAAAGAVAYTQSRLELRHFFEALAKRSTQLVKAMVISDSKAEGDGVSGTIHNVRWMGRLRTQLPARLGMATPGDGFIPAYYAGLATDETTRGGNTASMIENSWVWGFGGKALSLPGTTGNVGTLTWPALPWDRIRVWYGKTNFLAGTFKVFVNGVDVTASGTLGGNGTSGASPAAVSCVDAGGKSGGYYWEYAAAASSNVVQVRGNTNSAFAVICGVEFLNGDNSAGFQVYDASHSGARVDHYLQASMAPAYSDWATLAPDLTIIELGTNGWSTVSAAAHQTNLAALVALVKAAAPNGMVLLVHSWRPGTCPQATWDDYKAAKQAVAAADDDVAFFDLSELWPALTTDGAENNGLMQESTNPVHPNTAGSQRMADIFTDLLAAGGPSAGGGGTGADGADGLGWTGGSYDAGTGVVTFTSDDGLGFSTGDLRGADGAGGVPWLVTPANGTVDAGALIQAALDTYDVAWIAAGTWTITTQVEVSNGQSVIGQGQGSTRLVAGAALSGADGAFILASGTESHFTLQGFEVDGNNNLDYGIYLYATATPTAPDISPDFVAILRDISAYDCNTDGFYIGGSGAYSGNLRETRILNCLSKHNGQWGFNLASSDMFLADCTTHGNGTGFGGFHTESGQAGNAKFSNCKAYYEDIGFDCQAVRCSWFGGEIQDCERGAHLAAGSHLVTTIDSCGDGGTSIGAVRIGGTGCKININFVGRSKPSGANGQSAGSHALEMQFGASVLNANVMVQAFGGGNDYSTALYQGSNRPAAGSSVVFTPTTMTT